MLAGMTPPRVVPGWTWSAAVLAVVVGCGGASGGPDAGAADAAVADAAPAPDADPARVCEPQDARETVCAPGCDGPSRWYWDGERCREVGCGACEGADCAGGYGGFEACVAAHAGCAPSLCRDTFGTWRWWEQGCGPYQCGFPAPQDCETGGPVCDCGLGRSWQDKVGCVDDPSCPAVDPLPPDQLCVATGGAWGPTCCDSACGAPCGDDCTSDACTCGPMEIFDAVRGCVTAARCFERVTGETCDGGARCDDGSRCCQACGGAGCEGPSTCIPPVCDDDPATDACGNNTLAP
jgi:hypothetical protein